MYGGEFIWTLGMGFTWYQNIILGPANISRNTLWKKKKNNFYKKKGSMKFKAKENQMAWLLSWSPTHHEMDISMSFFLKKREKYEHQMANKAIFFVFPHSPLFFFFPAGGWRGEPQGNSILICNKSLANEITCKQSQSPTKSCLEKFWYGSQNNNECQHEPLPWLLRLLWSQGIMSTRKQRFKILSIYMGTVS